MVLGHSPHWVRYVFLVCSYSHRHTAIPWVVLSQLIHSCSSGSYLHMIRFFFLGSDNSRLAAFSWYGLLVYMTHKLYSVSVCCVWLACLLGDIYVKRTHFFVGCLSEMIHFSPVGYFFHLILFWYMEPICSWGSLTHVGFVMYFRLTRIERVSVSVGTHLSASGFFG